MASRRRHDSNEDEATAIDMREASSKIHAALANRKKALASPNAPTKKAHLASEAPLHGGDESGEEDTEFLARPASVQSAAEDSRTAAVPRKLEAVANPPTVPPASKGSRDQPPARAASLPAELPRPVALPAALPAALPRAPRPLPGRDDVTEAHPVGGTAGPTAPRITRIFASPDAQRRPTPEELQRHLPDFDDELTAPSDPATHKPAPDPSPPAPRAPTILAATGRDADATDPPQAIAPPPRARTARNKTSSSTTGGGTETLEAEPADGTLIVDVPAGAVVFVNGVERGRGPSLRVRELDRYAKHAVRVHADGFTPWKGSVSLDGRVAAKVRPNLRARER